MNKLNSFFFFLDWVSSVAVKCFDELRFICKTIFSLTESFYRIHFHPLHKIHIHLRRTYTYSCCESDLFSQRKNMPKIFFGHLEERIFEVIFAAGIFVSFESNDADRKRTTRNVPPHDFSPAFNINGSNPKRHNFFLHRRRPST